MRSNAAFVFWQCNGDSTFPSEYDVEEEVTSADAEQLLVTNFRAGQIGFVKRAFAKRADAEFGIGTVQIDLDRAAHKWGNFGHGARGGTVDGALEGFQQQRLGFALSGVDGATAFVYKCRDRVETMDDAALRTCLG